MSETFIFRSALAVMFGAQEVLVIVIVTAIVVFIAARDRRRKR